MRVALGFVSAVALVAAVWVFARDVAHDPRPQPRAAMEAAVPLLVVAALVWSSWGAL